MSRLPPARPGSALEIRHQPVEFSYYPMRRGSRRWGVHSMLYAADPWAVITSAVKERCPAATRTSAESFVRQAREFFSAAELATTFETKPLLYYYSFLNLGKAMGLARGRDELVGSVMHGIKHDFVDGETIDTAKIKVFPSNTGTINAYAELHETITGAHLPSTMTLGVADVLPQSVVAHRLLVEATGAAERFLNVDNVEVMHDPAAQQLWLVLLIDSSRIGRRGLGLQNTMVRSNLSDQFRPVEDVTIGTTTYRRFEMIDPVTYTHRAADDVMNLVDRLKPELWRTITSTRPYRRYYLYFEPDQSKRLPQELAIYALLFFLGSLTRYRPAYLLGLIDGPHGAFLREFLATQPAQLVYSLATEVKMQEVTRAAVV